MEPFTSKTLTSSQGQRKQESYHYQLVAHRMRNKLIVWVQFPWTEANITKVELIDITAGSTWEVKDRILGETWPPSERGGWSHRGEVQPMCYPSCVTIAWHHTFLLWGNVPSVLCELHRGAKPRDLLPAWQGGTPSDSCFPWEPHSPRKMPMTHGFPLALMLVMASTFL